MIFSGRCVRFSGVEQMFSGRCVRFSDVEQRNDVVWRFQSIVCDLAMLKKWKKWRVRGGSPANAAIPYEKVESEGRRELRGRGVNRGGEA